MVVKSPDEGKRAKGIVLRGMLLKYCGCGHPIGIETTRDPHRFYDGGDWDCPVEACPSCGRLIEADRLEFSEEQAACLGRAYRYLLGLARASSQTGE